VPQRQGIALFSQVGWPILNFKVNTSNTIERLQIAAGAINMVARKKDFIMHFNPKFMPFL